MSRRHSGHRSMNGQRFIAVISRTHVIGLGEGRGCHTRRAARMEPLWSPVVATGGNQRQIDRAPKPQKQAKSVAIGCDRLLETFHGKECHEEGPPGEQCSARPWKTKGGPFRCCTPVWISVASVSTSTCSTVRAGRSRSARHRPTLTDYVV